MSTKKEQDNETVTFRVPYKVLGIGALMFLSGTGAGGGLSSLVTFSPDKVKKTHQEQEDALGALINTWVFIGTIASVDHRDPACLGKFGH